MKHIQFFLTVAVASTTLFSGCLFQEEDSFGESAALRSEHLVDKVYNLLYTPENGWVMQYFATRENSFEYYDEIDGDYVTIYTTGCNIYCKFFKNKTCILGSDHKWIRNYSDNSNNTKRAYVTDTTMFDMNEQDGPVLSFNTWNEIISVFSDPTTPKHWDFNTYGDNALDGEGLHGDAEFIIKEVNDNEIIMKGQRHEGIVRLVRLDIPAEEYRSQVNVTEKLIISNPTPNFLIMSDNGADKDTIFAYGASNSVFGFSYVKSADMATTFQSFITTPTGIRFQRPVDLSFYKVNAPGDTTFWNHTTQEFTYSADKQTMVSEDGKLSFMSNWCDFTAIRVNNEKNVVNFEQTQGDTVWQKLCADLSAAITSAYPKQSLLGVTFGNSSDTGANRRFGLCFKTSAKVFAGITASATANQDVLTFDVNTEDSKGYSGALKTYVGKGLGDYFFAVANYLKGSWKMSCDDTFAPSKITLTNTADATKVIILTIK